MITTHFLLCEVRASEEIKASYTVFHISLSNYSIRHHKAHCWSGKFDNCKLLPPERRNRADDTQLWFHNSHYSEILFTISGGPKISISFLSRSINVKSGIPGGKYPSFWKTLILLCLQTWQN